MPFKSKTSLLKVIFGVWKGNHSYVSLVANQCTLWLSLINFLLIIICNPAITNPGPSEQKNKLSVLYHNLRGFVPPDDLGKPDPMLNIDKLLKFQSYVYRTKPDILILNETWLSKNINDNEKILIK